MKERFAKHYRLPALDAKLTKQRVTMEARALGKCRDNGIRTPALYFIDLKAGTIYMEYLEGAVTVKEHLRATGIDPAGHGAMLAEIGSTLAKLHLQNMIRGDLTTSNMMLTPGDRSLVMIDFGLSYISTNPEDKAVDLYVLERAFSSTHPDSQPLFGGILAAYAAYAAKPAEAKVLKAVLTKLEDVQSRGRKRSMLG